MHFVLLAVANCAATALPVAQDVVRAAELPTAIRAVLVAPVRVTPQFLASWKAKGVTSVVVPLDEATKRNWASMASAVEREEMALWAWIEVARNPAMADQHPEWMAAPGGHHDDWRRRFPGAPQARPGEVIKAFPWVPIGYAPAFAAHRARLGALLDPLPGAWSGVFVNDLQAGPSSCGCGNDQCRWALDYGSPATAERTPGDDAAARIIAELRARHVGKTIVPVWVTECEPADLPGAKDGTGLCGGVSCAKGDCWPRYVRQWNPLVRATDGPVAVALWAETFKREHTQWIDAGLALFGKPPREGTPLAPEKTVAIIEAWDRPEPAIDAILERIKQKKVAGWVLALDPINQSWEPRAVPIGSGGRSL
jgi:hypothetical protein